MENSYNVERISASTQVIHSIRAAITEGKYKVGDKLPNEQSLCEEIGVGRSSLREGMRILSAYGIVEIRQGDGSYITDNYEEHVFEFLGYMPENRNITYLLELREMIEVGSVKYLCGNGCENAYAELKKISDRISAQASTDNNVAADKKFHAKLVELTENPLSIKVYKMLSRLQSLLMEQLMCHGDVLSDAIHSHSDICEAIKVKDVEACTRAVENHIDHIRDYCSKYIEHQNTNK